MHRAHHDSEFLKYMVRGSRRLKGDDRQVGVMKAEARDDKEVPSRSGGVKEVDQINISTYMLDHLHPELNSLPVSHVVPMAA